MAQILQALHTLYDQQAKLEAVTRLLDKDIVYQHTSNKYSLDDLLDRQDIDWLDHFDEMLIIHQIQLTDTTISFTFSLSEFSDVSDLLLHCRQLESELQLDILTDDMCSFGCGHFRYQSGFCSLHRHCDINVYKEQHSLRLKKQKLAWLEHLVDFFNSSFIPQHFSHRCEDGTVIDFNLVN